MKLLSFISWTVTISPFFLILAKCMDWINWSWLITIAVAVAIPCLFILGMITMAIWVIRNTPPDEWAQ